MACDTTIGLCADGSNAQKELKSTGKAVEDFGKKATKDLKKMGDGIANAGKKFSLFVTGPIAAFSVGALKLASDAEEIRSKFNVVFGEFAEESAAWAEDFAQSVGRATTDVVGWMASLQDTFVPLGFAREAAADMSKELAKLTVDVASFNNVAEKDVIRDFQSALVGNTETVRKYGIIITQASLDQELLNMGIEGGVKAASEAEKVQARMNIIMAGTADAQGDAIRTADSFANRMRALKSRSQELLESFGALLIPTISKLVEKITGVVNWINNLEESQKKWILRIAGIAAAIGPLLFGIGKLISIIPALKAGFAALNVVMSANPILAIVAAVAALTTGVILLIKHWDKVVAFFTKAFDRIRKFAEEMPGWLLAVITAVAPFIGLPLIILRNWDKVAHTLVSIWIWLRDNVTMIFDQMKLGVLKAMAAVVEALIKMREKFPGEATKMREALTKLNAAIVTTKEDVEGATRTTWDLAKAEAAAKREAKELEKAQREADKALKDVKESVKEEKEEIEKDTETKKENIDITKAWGDQNIGINQLLSDQAVVYGTLNEKIAEHATLQFRLNEALTGIGTSLVEVGEVFRNSFANSMEAAFTSAETLGGAIKETMKGLLVDLLKMMGKQLALTAAAHLLNIPPRFGKAAATAALSAAVFAAAGAIQTLQQGGIVQGSGLGDTVPLLTEPGEMIVSKENVRRNRAALNQAQGGMGGGEVYNIYLGEDLIYSNLTEAIDNRKIKVRKESLV